MTRSWSPPQKKSKQGVARLWWWMRRKVGHHKIPDWMGLSRKIQSITHKFYEKHSYSWLWCHSHWIYKNDSCGLSHAFFYFLYFEEIKTFLKESVDKLLGHYKEYLKSYVKDNKNERIARIQWLSCQMTGLHRIITALRIDWLLLEIYICNRCYIKLLCMHKWPVYWVSE